MQPSNQQPASLFSSGIHRLVDRWDMEDTLKKINVTV